MKIIWHGTASVEIQSGVSRFLTDPFVPLKGADRETDISEYDGFTDILVTHGHFDHIINIPGVIRRNPQTIVHCTETPYRTLKNKGVPENNLRPLSYGESFSIGDFSIEVFHGRHAVLPKATPARIRSILRNKHSGNIFHIGRICLSCKENDETVMYAIHAEGKEITLMGSLNLREDVAYPQGSGLLLLPYNGWEDNFPPAVRVMERLKPEKVLLTHWDDTFPPLTGPIDLNPFLEKYRESVIECSPGGSIIL